MRFAQVRCWGWRPARRRRCIDTSGRVRARDPAPDVLPRALERPRLRSGVGEVLLTVSARWGSAGARVWSSPDGTVLRAEIG
ncbi:hypothetical protein ASG36_03745 [Geodermatophilus sp. Leaf369]|uniref:hypothetical protein n=1 Tax=Geodermatophilus sp. Leaf369 TaxID=1736354 RepID=UPI0006FEA736|nr:hypothetical protein [Geodermatophilus sp. Leaf369]KQS60112.1 hypothetical protein ASG36_03745 [Geodermatophilus sp. Leaf369]